MQQFEEYAKLLVEVGVNIQEGQNLVIACPVECAWFARLCARAAYAAGCREVVMNWKDDALSREKYLHGADDVFDSVPAWQSAFYNGYAREGAAYLAISASDPENLKGVATDRIVRSQRSSNTALEEFYRLQMSNGFPWCVASVPIPSWAQKAFPGLEADAAVAKLWDAIFAAVRVNGDGGAVERWRHHLATLKDRVDKLNALDLESLHYTNSLGTDLTICLPHRGDLHRPPPGRRGRRGLRLHAPGPRREYYRQVPLCGQGRQDRGGPRPGGGGDPAGRHLPGRGGLPVRRGGPGALRQPYQQPEAPLLQHPL